MTAPRAATIAGILATIAVTVVFRRTSLDIDLQALAYGTREVPWPHAHRFPWKALHDFGTWPGLALALGAIAAAAMSFADPRRVRWRFPALYIVALTALGPGVLTNLFGKVLAGRPRPEEIVEFGGTLEYLAPFDFGTPGRGFSFLCGHCSMGFLFFALAFLVTRHRAAVLIAASLFGLLLGTARVAAGAHFPSDILLDGTLMFTLAAALAPIARIEPKPVAAKRKRVYAAAALLAVVLIVTFLFSTPINRERVHTWTTLPRPPATHEKLYAWRSPRRLVIDAERARVVVRSAPQRERVRITTVVRGYGFPGADGAVDVHERAGTITYRLTLERLLWEAHATIEVVVASDVRIEVSKLRP